MTNFERMIRMLEERAAMTAIELSEALGIHVTSIRGMLGTAMSRGYVQSVKKPKQTVHYAVTSKEYNARRLKYRRPIAWKTADGMSWILPSVYTIAAIRNVTSGHPWGCVTHGWRFMGDYLEFV